MATLHQWRFSLVVIVMALCFFFILGGAEEEQIEPNKHKQNLFYDLFEKKSYNPLIRPVRNHTDPLSIEISLALSQIINVDEVNQVMKSNVWLQLYWVDFQLTFDSTLYGNTGSIKISPEKVWVPDIVLFNNAGSNYEVTYKSNVVLYEGMVNWIPPAIYESSCKIDVKYFPFDEQRCKMKFGSWTYKGTDLKFKFYKNRNKLDLADYLKSGSWDLIDCPGHIETLSDPSTGETREVVTFTFVIRRKTLFYTVNLIIPVILISFVSVLVFALPADAGEKMTLCISVLLALVVFLLLVSKILPPSTTIPLIAKYLLFTFLLNLIAILCTVIVINRNYRTPRTHRMPYWVRVVFLRELPRFLFMQRPDHMERWKEAPPATTATSPASTINYRGAGSNLNVSCNLGEYPESQHGKELNTFSRAQRNEIEETAHFQESDIDSKHAFQQSGLESPRIEMTPEMEKALESVKFIYGHLKTEEEYDTVLDDWKYVARVMDRLLLLIFLTVGGLGTMIMFLGAPHILEHVDQEKIIQKITEELELAESLSGD